MLPRRSAKSTSGNCEVPPVFTKLLADLGYDADQQFSRPFITNLGRLQDGKDSTVWPIGFKTAKTLRDLIKVFITAVADLGLGDATSSEDGRTSSKVKVAYVFRHPKPKNQVRHPAPKPYERKSIPNSDKPVIETAFEQAFLFNREPVYREAKKMLEFWRGQAMRGPADKDELARKCYSCPFKEACPER